MSVVPQLRNLAINKAQFPPPLPPPNSVAENPKRKFNEENKKKIFISYALFNINPPPNFIALLYSISVRFRVDFARL